MPLIRAVLDTNTLISALFWGGIPWEVYHAAAEEKYILLATEALIAEFVGVLHRPKFAPALATIQKLADDIVREHRQVAELVVPIEIFLAAVRDPKDRVVLACAIGGRADYIVSGDKDLLVLEVFQGIPILTVASFLQVLGR